MEIGMKFLSLENFNIFSTQNQESYENIIKDIT